MNNWLSSMKNPIEVTTICQDTLDPINIKKPCCKLAALTRTQYDNCVSNDIDHMH